MIILRNRISVLRGLDIIRTYKTSALHNEKNNNLSCHREYSINRLANLRITGYRRQGKITIREDV